MFKFLIKETSRLPWLVGIKIKNLNHSLLKTIKLLNMAKIQSRAMSTRTHMSTLTSFLEAVLY